MQFGRTTKGTVIWFCGLPSSGKSTLARRVAAESERPALVLDGDEVRDAIRPQHGYDETSRAEFYETLARLAALAASQGFRVLVPATANRRRYRELAQRLAPRWLEVFVDTPFDVCAARDAKGLYRDAGARAALPGVGTEFEAPENPSLRITPDQSDAVSQVLISIRNIESPGIESSDLG